MDWLEEKWENLRQKLKNTELIRGMFCYLFLGLISAVVLSLLTRNICESWMNVIYLRDPDRADSKDLVFLAVELLYDHGLLFFILLTMGVSVRLFFKRKLYPAIYALRESLGSLAVGDYSHELLYQSQDEMGSLCKEAEYLRNQLISDRKRQWESEEDQRSINAAFAHDIRTPLTVMKGYTEYLLKYLPQGKISQEVLLEKLKTIQAQQERLISFTKTMADIRQMEKRVVNGEWQQIGELEKRIASETEALMENQEEVAYQITADLPQKGEIFVDVGMVLEVLDNLIHNALRYAKNRIEVCIQLEERRLTLFVRDNGCGFTERALRTGSRVYYSEAKEDGEHFGMGLFICKNLCEKHGGGLTLINSVEGGAIATAEFFCRCR